MKQTSLHREEKNTAIETDSNWKKTFDIVQDLIFIIDKNYQIKQVNKIASEVFGKSPNELIGLPCFQCVHKTTELMSGCPCSQLFKDGKSRSVEIYDKNLNKNLAVDVAPLYDATGEIEGAVHVIRDITEKVRAKKALQRRDVILQSMANATENFLSQKLGKENVQEVLDMLGGAIDTSYAFIMSNKKSKSNKLLTSIEHEWYSPKVDSNLYFSNFKSENYYDNGFERWQKLLNKGEVISDKINEFPESESIKLLNDKISHIVIVPIFVQKKWWGVIGFIDHDATHEWLPMEINALKTVATIFGSAIWHKKEEIKLQDSEKKFRILANHVPGIIYLCDNDERYTMHFLSNTVEKITGYKKEDFLTNKISFTDLYHPDDKANIYSIVNAAIENREQFRLEYRLKHRTLDEWRWIEERGSGVFNSQGDKLLFLEGFLLDITRRKMYEQKMKESLVEKEILLKEIHHRVKNNLQTIIALVSMQSKYINDDKLLHWFDDLKTRAKTMALLHQTLHQSDNLSHINIYLYLSNLTNQLISSYRTNPNIKVRVNASDISMNIDVATNCGLIVSELVTNTLKYAFINALTTTPQLIISVDGTVDKFTLLVKDNGIGLQKSFEDSSNESFGMHLIKILTSSSEYSIKVDTALNVGTVFTITYNKIKPN